MLKPFENAMRGIDFLAATGCGYCLEWEMLERECQIGHWILMMLRASVVSNPR